MSSVVWDHDVAEVYDQTYRAKFEPSVLDPIVDLLAGLAGSGPALESALGTGRVALPLSARGVTVHGLELSPHMAAQPTILNDGGSGLACVAARAGRRAGDRWCSRCPCGWRGSRRVVPPAAGAPGGRGSCGTGGTGGGAGPGTADRGRRAGRRGRDPNRRIAAGSGGNLRY